MPMGCHVEKGTCGKFVYSWERSKKKTTATSHPEHSHPSNAPCPSQNPIRTRSLSWACTCCDLRPSNQAHLSQANLFPGQFPVCHRQYAQLVPTPEAQNQAGINRFLCSTLRNYVNYNVGLISFPGHVRIREFLQLGQLACIRFLFCSPKTRKPKVDRFGP